VATNFVTKTITGFL